MSERQPKAVANDTVQTTTRLALSAKNLMYNHIHGQPQGLSLRFNVFSNLLTTVSRYVNYYGGSKPPPYTV